MGAVVQDDASASSAGDPGRHRLLPGPPARAGQDAARRAREAHSGPLQLLWSERQPSEPQRPRVRREACLAQVASHAQPKSTPHLEEVLGAAPAFASSRAADLCPDLGHVTMRRVGGRAGWWKSPCPDLARASAGQPAEATRHHLVSRAVTKVAWSTMGDCNPSCPGLLRWQALRLWGAAPGGVRERSRSLGSRPSRNLTT